MTKRRFFGLFVPMLYAAAAATATNRFGMENPYVCRPRAQKRKNWPYNAANV